MKKVKPMQVLLTQKEIAAAVRGYVQAQGLNLDGKNVSIEFTATRSRETGVVGTVTILNDGETAPVTLEAVDDAPALNVINAPTETKREEPVLASGTKTADPAPFLAAVEETKKVETKVYADGASATGTAPLPDVSPVVEADKVEPEVVKSESTPEPNVATAEDTLFGEPAAAANEAVAAPTTTDNLFG